MIKLTYERPGQFLSIEAAFASMLILFGGLLLPISAENLSSTTRAVFSAAGYPDNVFGILFLALGLAMVSYVWHGNMFLRNMINVIAGSAWAGFIISLQVIVWQQTQTISVLSVTVIYSFWIWFVSVPFSTHRGEPL